MSVLPEQRLAFRISNNVNKCKFFFRVRVSSSSLSRIKKGNHGTSFSLLDEQFILDCFTNLSDCIAECNCQIKERLIRQRHPIIK